MRKKKYLLQTITFRTRRFFKNLLKSLGVAAKGIFPNMKGRDFAQRFSTATDPEEFCQKGHNSTGKVVSLGS